VSYSPYGVPDTSVDGFAYTGEMRDGNGLQYHRARYYSPNMANWTAMDRAEQRNRYAYVSGNTINRYDPTGLFDEDTCTVERGDYLEAIAVRAGVYIGDGSYVTVNSSHNAKREATASIAALNGIRNPNIINEGMRLTLPANRRNLCTGEQHTVEQPVEVPPTSNVVTPNQTSAVPTLTKSH
jgi:RHS repeat-associated protein